MPARRSEAKEGGEKNIFHTCFTPDPLHMKNFCIYIVLLLSLDATAQPRVHFSISGLSREVGSSGNIFLAGSFNGWQPGDSAYMFTKDQAGEIRLDLGLQPGKYEFKLTRGSWDKAECHMDGQSIANRFLEVTGDATVELVPEAWTDQFQKPVKHSTAGKQVMLLDTAFYIPQLKRHRAIHIYLPADYSVSKKRYPVLYMHDGQNLFNDSTSYAGEWGVDECLDSMKKQCIVVGIDNGPERIHEYCAYDMKEYGKAEGRSYVDFLVKTLKPFIDKKFRTLPGHDHTFIAGSSLGGLISLYAVLRYPAVFGGAGLFSTSLWINPEMWAYIRQRAPLVHSKLFFYAGKQEDETMVQNTLKALKIFMKTSHSATRTVIRDEGRHNEATWRREFPGFYEFLLK